MYKRMLKWATVPFAILLVAVAANAAPASRAPRFIGKFEPMRPVGSDDMGEAGVAGASSNPLMTFHGGRIENNPKVYLVFWGPNWNTGTGDPRGVSGQLRTFVSNLPGSDSTWLNSVTQYCQGVPTGATSCPSNTDVSNLITLPPTSALAGVWFDKSAIPVKAPKRCVKGVNQVIKDPYCNKPFVNSNDVANEAEKAANKFGNLTSDANKDSNYLIALPPKVGNCYYDNDLKDCFGIKTGFCAYHGAVTDTANSAIGQMSAIDLPYVTQVGPSCGAGLGTPGTPGATDGVTIVGGHEIAESMTDPDPEYNLPSGWFDINGGEDADKCAWVGVKNVAFNGNQFAVQPLWSNAAAAAGKNGCVQSSP